MSAAFDLMVTVRGATQVYCGPNVLTDRIRLGGLSLDSGPAPWPSCPDILYNATTKEWVGLTYQVQPEYRDTARPFIHDLDSRVVRYDAASAATGQLPYGPGWNGAHFLEIRWTQSPADACAFAQLSKDIWYYRYNDTDSYSEPVVYAVGVLGAHEVLDAFGLWLRPQLEHGDLGSLTSE